MKLRTNNGWASMTWEPRRRKRSDDGNGENQNEYPKISTGMGRSCAVREVLAHYESQTEDEQFAEIEAALESENVTLMAVPSDLVPEVRALLARSQSG